MTRSERRVHRLARTLPMLGGIPQVGVAVERDGRVGVPERPRDVDDVQALPDQQRAGVTRSLPRSPFVTRAATPDKRNPSVSSGFLRADDGVRTHDPQLGKLMLYQLSYVRVERRIAR